LTDRLDNLIANAHALLDSAIAEHVAGARRELAGVVILFSGGNDSTTLAHLFRERATHAAHANTGIGIEQTRQFVRDTCASWGLPLIEKCPPAGSTYRELVLDQGFPGPGHHWKMYQRLKERCLDAVRMDLISNPWRQRVVYLAGRRRDESKRRTNVPEVQRDGSVLWVSPLVDWTRADLNAYRRRFTVPRNTVADLLHMSGECLCGAFAHRGELAEIGYWFPEVRAHIESLEADVRATGKHPEKRCAWGWGANSQVRPSKVGPLCSSCDARHEEVTT